MPAIASPPTVSWPDAGSPIATIPMACPNCRLPGERAVALTVHFETPDHPLRHSRVLRCEGCACLFYENQTPPDYTEPAMLGRGRVGFYLQQGAGLSLITNPLARVPRPRGSRYLEVGCGFGFGLDFAIRAKGWHGSGIDPGGIAALGAARLGVAIEQRYLGEAEPQWNGVCDVVMASETIEHVRSPAAFIATLRRALRDDGVLILTTPAGELLHQGQSPGLLVPLLSPGLHLVFQTRASLRRLLEDAGFSEIVLTLDGSSLVAYASAAPLRLLEDPAAQRELYRDYLLARGADATDDLDLALGFLGRALQEAVNDAQMAQAARAFAALSALCRERFGLDLDTIEALPEAASRCPLEHLAELMPLNLGGILHADAIRRLASGTPRAGLGCRFVLAAAAAEALLRALGELAMADGMSEAIAWAARAEALLCDAAAGDADLPGRLRDLPPPCDASSGEAASGGARAEARRRAIVERALAGAVNAGHYALGRDIAALAEFRDIDAPETVASPMTATWRDALFCLGVLDLQPNGDPVRARTRMERVRRVMQPPGPDDDVPDLFWAALRGESLAIGQCDSEAAAASHRGHILASVNNDAIPHDWRAVGEIG
jgi:SAM-dependent methyltransferase